MSRNRQKGSRGRTGRSGRKAGPTLRQSPVVQTLARVGVISIIGLLFGYLVATQVLFPAPGFEGDMIEVPRLVGLSSSEASGRAGESGLRVEVVDSLLHPTVPEGEVFGQSPLPGQLITSEGGLRIAVSLGPEHRPVPDVLSLRVEGAVTVLEATGFTVSIDSVEAESPLGSVVSLEPEVGTDLALPSEVTLVMSLGPPLVEMPDLLGMTEEDARAALDSLGIGVAEVETRFRFGRDRGLVIGQDPSPLTMVERGGEIRLVVGRRSRGGI